ncbi:MAG: tyrosine-type recombinase/integrase [Terriglobales bacterium]
MGFVRERPGTNGGVRYQALYDDVKGHRRSAGTFVTEAEAVRAWQRAEDRQADGRSSDTRRTRQRFRRYVEDVWLPHHEMEARTRETYTYYLNKHILPVFGSMRINEIQPADVREWVSDLKAAGASPTVIRQCHTILSAVFTTAFNDQMTRLHPCRGVKTPPVAKKLRTIITPDQFDQLYTALPSDTARLMAEVLIESGLRWAELIELRPIDLNTRMRMLTVSRVAVELVAKFHPTGGRFLIKDYPKDREHRRIKLALHIADQLQAHITEHELAPDDLLFTPTLVLPRAEPSPLQLVSEPVDLGLTEPNAAGRQYRHGTLTGYNPGGCKCEHCRGAYATYRAERRAAGKDQHAAPRTTRSRTLTTDGHIPRSWFREHVWKPALDAAGIGVRVRTHDLRHAHASWLLAGGADLQTVKERLGHGSIVTTEKYLHTLAETDDIAVTALAAIRQRGREN